MKSANNNPNPNAASQATQSWAHTVSDYILQRRAQNKVAYETVFSAQNIPTAVVNTAEQGSIDILNDENNDWLFKALFIALAQQLEEGHTVLTLSTDIYTNASLKNTLDGSSTLQSWQQRLMTILLLPLSEYIDSASITMQEDMEQGEEVIEGNFSYNPINQLLTQWPQVATQLALSQEMRKLLGERHELGHQLYELFQTINESKLEKENSLSKLIELIYKSGLFSKTSINETTPIKFSQYKQDSALKLTLWMQRTWQAEHTLADKIQTISNYNIKPLFIAVNDQLNAEQQAAIDVANNNAFSIITGGPGTGKTYTVAQLVIALKSAQVGADTVEKNSANLALAAPTGKAAQRMQESLQAALDTAGVSMQLQEAKTIHRLLGIGQSGQPRYHADNPLSEDIIIIDEASMLGVELANQLVSAIKPGARLILLGDANQLAAVDAGAVLADLCRIPMLQSNHQQLTESRRFTIESGIGQLAVQINNSETDMATVWQLFAKEDTLNFYSVNAQISNKETDVNKESIKNSLSNLNLLKKVKRNYEKYIRKVIAVSTVNKKNSEKIILITELLNILNEFRVLTAGHYGRWGDHFLNNYLSEWHINELKLPLSNSPWFHGRPVMVLQNSYELGLFNGDIGICLQTQKGLEVFFENKQQGIAVNLFSDEMIATAYAMTIHKSQGSEFEHVAVCFEDSNSRLLSQELIYTAVTRAKQKVSIFSTVSAFTRALNTPTVRQTGLSLQFSKFD